MGSSERLILRGHYGHESREMKGLVGMATNEPRNFDSNIEKILEGWEVRHAIREVIANALDEQVLAKTQDITIKADSTGNWHIRDLGRGIRYENLTQNENPEKLKNAGNCGF
jgi:hypothetical protein